MVIHLHHDGLSRPLENAKLRVLSLGAGVQSTTLALMAARGEIGPAPDCAIFADTGWEPRKVYRHLEWLESVLPFPVVRVRRDGPDLGEQMLRIAAGQLVEKGAPLIPYFANEGMVPKQCSKEFKTRPVARHVRDMLGLKPKERGPKEPCVEMWLGISTDEITRCKFNEKKYIINRWPLVEARMNRRNCIKWMEDRQYPKAPRSACVFCPFHSRAEWRDMHDNEPEDWTTATVFDGKFRNAHPNGAYLVAERVPLAQVDFKRSDAPGLDFANECEGICGV